MLMNHIENDPEYTKIHRIHKKRIATKF